MSTDSSRINSQDVVTPKAPANEVIGSAGESLEASLLDAQARVLGMIQADAPLPETLALLARMIESQSEHGDSVASILLLDEAGRLRTGAAPSLPDDYNRAIDGLAPDENVGTCAASAATGQVVVTTSIEDAPGWSALKRLPLALGLESAWSMPILSSGNAVLGTIGTYFRSRRGPSVRETSVVENLARLAALAIERRTTNRSLVEARRRIDSALIAGEVGTFEWDIVDDRLFGDANFRKLFGIELGDAGAAPLSSFVGAIHPDDRERVLGLVAQTVERGLPYIAEYRIVTGGATRWVVARGKLERDDKGNAVRFPGVLLDITERRRAETDWRAVSAEFERQTRVYDAILSATTDFAYILDLTGRFLYANRRLLEVWGVTLDQAVGKSLFELGYPRWHAEMHLRELAHVISTKRPIRGEVPFTGGSGISGVYDYTFFPILGPDGSVEVVGGMTRDVTERKRREDRDKFLVLLDDAARPLVEPHAITQTCARMLGRQMTVSRCAYADVELDQDTFNLTGDFSDGVRSIVGRYTFAQFGGECLRLMRAGEPYVVEDSETDPRCAENRESYRATEIGAVICVPVMKQSRFVAAMAVHNKTPRAWRDDEVELVWRVAQRCWESIERSRISRELRSSESRYRKLVETISSVIWLTDGEGRIVVENPSWGAFTGQLFEEYRGRGWLQAIHPDDREATGRLWHAAVAARAPYEARYRLKRHDGAYRHVIARGAPVTDEDAEGSLREWVGNCTDVTDETQLREQIQYLLESERAARVEAERASRMKDEFLATLSHELRTPLNAIVGWSGILRSDAGRQDPRELSEGLEIIERNARAQTQIIEDLLDMSRIVSGKVRLEMGSVSLADAIDSAVKSSLPAADAKRISLRTSVELGDDEPRRIAGDANRVQQILWNLVSNAIKFTPGGGEIAVTLRRSADRETFAIEVADTGEGIKPEFLPFVFDRFRQADASPTRRHGGLGLGLSIVKQLVELHGGSVGAFSEGSGKGARFVVNFPVPADPFGSTIAPAAPAGADLATPTRPGDASSLLLSAASATAIEELSRLGKVMCEKLADVRVLVVDDEADARELVRRLLEECQVKVATASSASQALAMIETFKPHVVISDIGMPGEDGHTFIRRVRQLPPGHGPETPAIALTAYARSEDRVRSLMSGFQMHLTKPIEARELIAMVASLARTRSPGSYGTDQPAPLLND